MIQKIGKTGNSQKIKGADFFDLKNTELYEYPYQHFIKYLPIGTEPDRVNDTFVFLDFSKIDDIAFSKTSCRVSLKFNGSLTFRSEIRFKFDFGDRHIYGNYKTAQGDAGASEISYISSFIYSNKFSYSLDRLEEIIINYDQDGPGPGRDVFYTSKIIVKNSK